MSQKSESIDFHHLLKFLQNQERHRPKHWCNVLENQQKEKAKWKLQRYRVQGRPRAATRVSRSPFGCMTRPHDEGTHRSWSQSTDQVSLDSSQKAYIYVLSVLLVCQGCLSVMSVLLREHWWGDLRASHTGLVWISFGPCLGLDRHRKRLCSKQGPLAMKRLRMPPAQSPWEAITKSPSHQWQWQLASH